MERCKAPFNKLHLTWILCISIFAYCRLVCFYADFSYPICICNSRWICIKFFYYRRILVYTYVKNHSLSVIIAAYMQLMRAFVALLYAVKLIYSEISASGKIKIIHVLKYKRLVKIPLAN